MLPALLALQALALLLLLFLLLRRAKAAPETTLDPRLLALLAADLPNQIARADVRADSVERLLRAELTQLRQEAADAAARAQVSALAQAAE